MAEVSTLVRPVRVQLFCDVCPDQVEMLSEPGKLLSNPPKYRHYCPCCGSVENRHERFPTIRFEEVPS